MTTSTATPEIVSFARNVRAALADLPADEVDELTEGLEADLAEAYAEDLQRELPDPASYAAELRLAAGLPARTKAGSGRFAGIGESLGDTRRDISIAIRRNPTLSGIADFLSALRPAWWLIRAWVAYQVVMHVIGAVNGHRLWLPTDLLQWLTLSAFVLVSVQWGRGLWRTRALGPLIVVGNVVAAMLLIPMISAAQTSSGVVFYGGEAEPQDLTGVYMNGAPVTNIFGYDADGKLLEPFQLFDQDGKPITTSVPGGNGCLDPDCNETGFWTPSYLETGQTAWNVFPMRMVRMIFNEQTGSDEPDPAAKAQDRKPPFVKVPAVVPAPTTVQPAP